MYQKVFLVVETLNQTELFESIVAHITQQHKAEPVIVSSKKISEEDRTDGSLFLLFLNDEEIRMFLQAHLGFTGSIGIIPDESCPYAIKNYGISKSVFEAIDDAFDPELLSEVDLFKCNELIVLNRVVIGDMHGMNRLDFNDHSSFGKIKIFFNNLKDLQYKNYTITTSKDQIIKTVASGITVIEHNAASDRSNIGDDFSIHDGKLNAFILAPTSLISYIWYLILIFFYQRISLLSLPKSLGFIKTSKLTIESNDSVEYLLDSNLLSAKNVELNVIQACLHIHLGRKLKSAASSDAQKIQDDDIVKVNAMPHGDISNILIDRNIPFFKKASEEDFKELFSSLRVNAKFSYIFLILLVLSTLLATTGLFANSAPVIIGAMILAPLMAPIISLAMGVIRSDEMLLTNSIKTLFLGIFTALFFSFVLTLFLPLEQITPEMQARIHPNLLDLMVAIFSGIAGAYAYSKEEVAKSLAGVAIAVALVPPLSVTGIGIGLGNINVIYGSFLLFSTNLVGITLSAALTFIVLGFAPVKRAKKGILYTSVMMVLITIPLVVSFVEMVEKNLYMKKLETLKTFVLENEKVNIFISNIQDSGDMLLIDIEAVTTKSLTLQDYQTIKREFEEKVERKVILKVIPEIIVK